MSATRSRGRSRAWRHALTGLRVLVTMAAFVYLAAVVDLRAFAEALRRFTPWSIAGALALIFAIVVLGTARWLILLDAYGATRRLGPQRALQLYFVGFFYNLYLPGAVGGDVLRGVASREAFGADVATGATAGVTVVFIERVMGLTGLIVLCAVSSLLWSVPVRGLGLAAGMGIVAALGAVLAVASGRRFASRLPGRLGRWMAGLPALRSAPKLMIVVALSVVLHFLLACAGHVLMVAIVPAVRLLDSVVIFPLGSAAAFFPLTVGGAGVREVALVKLFAVIGVDEPSALAGSLSLFGAQLIVAAFGGLIHLLRPLSPR